MAEMAGKGKKVVVAHLRHLKEHGETGLVRQGVDYLWAHRDELAFHPSEVIEDVHQLAPVALSLRMAAVSHHVGAGCPGSREAEIRQPGGVAGDQPSELTHWPIQLHLVNPAAGYFHGADLLVAADCTAFASGNFHSRYLKNRKLVIACPKLDQGRDIYIEKFRRLIGEAGVRSVTVLRMEVPCCGGLVQMVRLAAKAAGKDMEIKEIVLGVNGEEGR